MDKVLKITEATGYNEDDYRGYVHITMEAGGKVLHDLSFFDGEPEDSNISRNFNDCLSITSALATVAKLVKRGYSVEFCEGDDSDND